MRNVLLLILICYTSFVSAKEGIQTDRGPVVAIKTNIPYWATATFNAGVEFRLARKWTLELEA